MSMPLHIKAVVEQLSHDEPSNATLRSYAVSLRALWSLHCLGEAQEKVNSPSGVSETTNGFLTNNSGHGYTSNETHTHAKKKKKWPTCGTLKRKQIVVGVVPLKGETVFPRRRGLAAHELAPLVPGALGPWFQ